jgi:hypothetical protein
VKAVPVRLEASDAAYILSQKFIMSEGIAGVSYARGSEPRIRIYIEDPEAEALVPEHIMGYPTEVIYIGRITLLSAPSLIGDVRKRARPIPGGVSIGTPNGGTGTMSCWVYERGTGKKLMLSNRHVFVGPKGTKVIQPGVADGGGVPDDVVGFVYKSSKIDPPPADNLIDAAIAEPISEDLFSEEIVGIGTVSGIVSAKEGMKVEKTGRTTGHTAGEIFDTHATVKVYGYEWGFSIFSDQIIIKPSMSKPGDSGSLIVESESKRAVGLLFAGSEAVTVANKIENVLAELNISLTPSMETPAPAIPRISWASIAMSAVPIAAVGLVIASSEYSKYMKVKGY